MYIVHHVTRAVNAIGAYQVIHKIVDNDMV
jgi:hypothetical protein